MATTNPPSKGVRKPLKKIAIIPTLLTLGNAVCGLASIAWATRIDPANPATEYCFAMSGWLIIAAMVFDALDGYIARLSKSASKFGAELDSLCDAVSFGAAPALLLMRMGPGWEPRPLMHQLLAGIAALFLVCVLLRLARFNVEHSLDPASHKRFRGLPSPGAAGCLASLAILRGELAEFAGRGLALDLTAVRGCIEVGAPLGALAVALLMVSRVPYPHITNQVLRGRRHFTHVVEVIFLVFVIVLLRDVALAPLFWGYALIIPLRYSLSRHLRREVRPAAAGLDDAVPR